MILEMIEAQGTAMEVDLERAVEKAKINVSRPVENYFLIVTGCNQLCAFTVQFLS